MMPLIEPRFVESSRNSVSHRRWARWQRVGLTAWRTIMVNRFSPLSKRVLWAAVPVPVEEMLEE